MFHRYIESLLKLHQETNIHIRQWSDQMMCEMVSVVLKDIVFHDLKTLVGNARNPSLYKKLIYIFTRTQFQVYYRSVILFQICQIDYE